MFICRSLLLRSVGPTVLIRSAPITPIIPRFKSSIPAGRKGSNTRKRQDALGKPVHIRYQDEVVRFVVPSSITIAKILRDAKQYFDVNDSQTELRDLASNSEPIPYLNQTILQLDSNPQAQFYFQLVSKSNEEISTSQKGDYEASSEDSSNSEFAEEEEEDDLQTDQREWRSSKKSKTTKAAQKRSRLTESQAKEYFTKFLRAKKLEPTEPSEEPPHPAFQGTNKLLVGLVRSILVSKKFKKYMTELRIPKFSDAGLAGFISYFLNELADKHRELNRSIRLYCLSHQKYLDEESPADAPSDSVVGQLRHALKTYLTKGAALYTSVETESKWQFTDLRNPWSWYKAARQFQRKIIIHTGPTNSGKTYHALERLIAAKSGMYCGPLRLLAHEIYEKLTSRGVTTSLLTGQQKIEPMFSTHVACTVEMTDTEETIDVAVIDEFQMIGDLERGWAWTRALLGVPAKEVHLCGDGSAVNLVARICTEFLGDTVEIRQYERLSPLVAVRGGINQSGIQKGDCIVAFSRQKIHALKQQVERQTGFRCCVIYGSLPPEARSTQARMFNDPNSGYDVLVASDAIGMGLNLNIRRVIFSAMLKFDGTEERTLTVSEIKQIAGRAGRYGSIYPEGRVTCIYSRDTSTMVESLKAPIPELKQAGLAPTFEQLEMFYLSDDSKPSLSVLLDRFALYASVDNIFFLCDYSNIRELAVLLEPLDLGLKDLYTFCLSPADANKPLVKHSLYQYASMYASKDIQSVPLRIDAGPNEPIYHGMPHLLDTIDDREKLKRLEELYNVADNYAWLSYRLPKFDERDKAFVVKNQVHALISALLDAMSEAQGEASWSRVERMRREAMLQRDAQAMRNLDRESRRTQKRNAIEAVAAAAAPELEANAYVVREQLLPNATLEESSETQLAFARAQVDAKALAQPTHQPSDEFSEKIRKVQDQLKVKQNDTRPEWTPPHRKTFEREAFDKQAARKPADRQPFDRQSFGRQQKQNQYNQNNQNRPPPKHYNKPQFSQFRTNDNTKRNRDAEMNERPTRRPIRGEK